MFRSLNFRKSKADELLSSKLYCDKTFYGAFVTDLKRAKQEVIIESPFITNKRIASLMPELIKLRQRGVCLTVNTRGPDEHDEYYRFEAIGYITTLQNIGINVLYTDRHYRKLAIIDRRILWEGSLNIQSESTSCEIMRRIESKNLANQMIQFIKIERFL